MNLFDESFTIFNALLVPVLIYRMIQNKLKLLSGKISVYCYDLIDLKNIRLFDIYTSIMILYSCEFIIQHIYVFSDQIWNIYLHTYILHKSKLSFLKSIPFKSLDNIYNELSLIENRIFYISLCRFLYLLYLHKKSFRKHSST